MPLAKKRLCLSGAAAKKTPASRKRTCRRAIAKCACADRFALDRAAYARANRADPIYACSSTGARRGSCSPVVAVVALPCNIAKPAKAQRKAGLRKI